MTGKIGKKGLDRKDWTGGIGQKELNMRKDWTGRVEQEGRRGQEGLNRKERAGIIIKWKRVGQEGLDRKYYI